MRKGPLDRSPGKLYFIEKLHQSLGMAPGSRKGQTSLTQAETEGKLHGPVLSDRELGPEKPRAFYLAATRRYLLSVSPKPSVHQSKATFN